MGSRRDTEEGRIQGNWGEKGRREGDHQFRYLETAIQIYDRHTKIFFVKNFDIQDAILTDDVFEGAPIVLAGSALPNRWDVIFPLDRAMGRAAKSISCRHHEANTTIKVKRNKTPDEDPEKKAKARDTVCEEETKDTKNTRPMGSSQGQNTRNQHEEKTSIHSEVLEQSFRNFNGRRNEHTALWPWDDSGDCHQHK